MGSVNKNCPLIGRAVPAKRQAEGGEDDELDAIVFLQEFAALAARIHTEDDNHGQKNDGWQNSFHNTLHLYAEIIHPSL